MEVETKSASLDTLAVTIQALHVSGKQMTLAVFRQLPAAYAYNDDGSMAPLEYWGIVRYAIKDEGDLWVIAASGGRLYRCRLDWHGDSVWRAEAELRNARSLVAWWKTVDEQKRSVGYSTVETPYRAPRWNADGLPNLEDDVADSESHLAVSQRAETTRAALSKLPQLFIAV